MVGLIHCHRLMQPPTGAKVGERVMAEGAVFQRWDRSLVVVGGVDIVASGRFFWGVFFFEQKFLGASEKDESFQKEQLWISRMVMDAYGCLEGSVLVTM